MKKTVIYIHGKGGSAEEAEHYRGLFPQAEVMGLDYKSATPWEASEEFTRLFNTAAYGSGSVTVIANSIGAYFAMHALGDKKIDDAFFISPITDMERLILNMMMWASVTEDELREKKEIPTAFGEMLSWQYLDYVRRHPIFWPVPTAILYGSADNMISLETVTAFAVAHNAPLTVMENGEHWFHTDEQMRFLDGWIRKYYK